jgi:gamma-glutamyltranspeptidase / glutathione hydrolase
VSRATRLAGLGLLAGALIAAQAPSTAKLATSRAGMVASGSSYATAAGVRALEAGGNAVDAAAAAAFALMVADPANTSLGGRAQILVRLASGETLAIDGATEAPAGVPPLRGPSDDRLGYAVASMPGAPAALDRIVRRYGKRSLAQALQPAIELAERGYPVPDRLAGTWARVRDQLARSEGAAANFLKPDGSTWKAGERFRQPVLARLLRRLADSGVAVLYHGAVAETIAHDMAGHGGYVTAADLAGYRAQDGMIVHTDYRGYDVASAGGRAWGNTLAEMLGILSHFELRNGPPDAREVELLARVIAQSLEDRPQQLGTLKPKADGLPLETLSSPAFAAERAERIRTALGGPPPSGGRAPNHEGDTSHLSVMDAEGNAVALTMSIGPSFGTRVSTPALGFIYAYSYRMRSDPTPNARDLTEMTPTIISRNGRPVLTIGGAGSERIPSAIMLVASNVIDRGWSLERAMAAPRLAAVDSLIRLHPEFPDAIRQALEARGFVVETIPHGDARHAGLVHAVQYNRTTGRFTGVADADDGGSAAGPRLPW